MEKMEEVLSLDSTLMHSFVVGLPQGCQMHFFVPYCSSSLFGGLVPNLFGGHVKKSCQLIFVLANPPARLLFCLLQYMVEASICAWHQWRVSASLASVSHKSMGGIMMHPLLCASKRVVSFCDPICNPFSSIICAA